MSTPSIIVGRGNWGVKTGNLLGYSLIDSLYLPREFTCSRANNTATRVNRNGNIEGVNANVPRIDYLGGQASLLVEPSGINGIRNNSMVGAVAGSPGTLPTNWTNAGSTLTRQSVATGTLNGIPYVDIRISGTASNTFHDVFWDASNVIAASVGQNWVASCYLQIIAQPNPPVSYNLAMREFDSTNGFLGVFQGAALSISTTSFNRFSFTRVLTQATVAFVHPSLFFFLVNGQYYDFTIRIGYPQMEQSSVATSVIPTTTGPVTRNADTISLTGATNLIGQTEGTIYAEVDIRNAFAGTFISLDIGSTADFLIIGRTSSFAVIVQIKKSSGSTVTIITSSAVALGVHKIALGYTNGDYALYIDGVSAGTSTNSTDYPSAALTRCNLAVTAYNVFNDRIRAAEIYPTRLPNVAQPGVLSLQSLTAI